MVNNFIVLKGDFHMHTVFSDGTVWPTERIIEAYHDDLDVVAITDHLEIQRNKQDIATSSDLNRSYEIAKETAKKYNILLVKGSEITREVPPGHSNAIFIKDASPLFNPTKNERPNAAEGYDVAVNLANEQGGFVFYNHPFHNLADDKVVMPQEVDKLISAGKIKGIEVVNGDRFSKEGYNWAIERNLTLISNSDVHTSMPLAMLNHNIEHRAITLVLAKDRSLESVREALESRRTLIWWRDNVIGRKDLLEQFVRACIPVTRYSYEKNQLTFFFENTSSQRFVMEPISTDEFFIAHPVVLLPNAESNVNVGIRNSGAGWVTIKFRVTNAWTNYEQPLVLEYTFKKQ
ncbi:MAG: Sb-PDE family phosphodiesterase [Paludibacter sp.]